MKTYKWLNLQLFADGAGDGAGDSAGAGAEAAAPVVTNADDGHESRLRALGVPEARIQKQRSYKSRAAKPMATAQQQVKQPDDSANVEAAPEVNGDNNTQSQPQQSAQRMTWDEIMQDPEYNKEMQKTMRARLKEADIAQQNLKAITPMLEVLARKYGMDPEKIDFDTLNKSVSNEDEFYEERAMRNGTDIETEKAADQRERDERREQRYSQEQIDRQLIAQHLENLRAQEVELKKLYPNFSLDEEMKNDAFLRLTAPGVNVPLKNIFFAMHADEINAANAQVVAQQTAKNISNTIQAGRMRPQETKTGQTHVTNFNRPSQAEIKARIEEARRAGKKYYPDGTIR